MSLFSYLIDLAKMLDMLDQSKWTFVIENMKHMGILFSRIQEADLELACRQKVPKFRPIFHGSEENIGYIRRKYMGNGANFGAFWSAAADRVLGHPPDSEIGFIAL